MGSPATARRRARVLIIVDKYGWSYDTIAHGIVDHARDADLAVDILWEKEDAGLIERRHDYYDLVFAMGWTSVLLQEEKDRLRRQAPLCRQDETDRRHPFPPRLGTTTDRRRTGRRNRRQR